MITNCFVLYEMNTNFKQHLEFLFCLIKVSSKIFKLNTQESLLRHLNFNFFNSNKEFWKELFFICRRNESLTQENSKNTIFSIIEKLIFWYYIITDKAKESISFI